MNDVQEQVLIELLDDWVGLWEIARMLQGVSPPASWEQRRSDAVRLIESLLTKGYIRAGDLTAGGVFVPWDMPAKAIAQKIDAQWRALGRDPDIGELCWFASTPAGVRMAREIMRARGTGTRS